MRVFILGLLAVFWSHLAIGQTLYTFNGGGTSGDWNNSAIWTTDPTGSTALNQRVPGSGDNVVITNSFVVNVSSSIATTGLNITIQKGGILDLSTYTIASLGSLSGQGTLRIGAPYFPRIAANGNNFDDAGTGTVEFYNWPATPTALPSPKSGQYNNLRLLNGTTTAYTAQLDTTLTLTGNLTLTATSTTGTTPYVTLNLGKAATARTLNVLGDVTLGKLTALGVSAVTLPTAVPPGGSTAVQTYHTINVSGSFTNNGTVNLHNGTTGDTQTALLNFTGATDANFACNGPTNLDILQVNKGVDSQVLLNVTATVATGGASSSNLTLNHVTSESDLLVLVNGVVKLGNNITLPKIHNGNTAGTGFTIGSSDTNPTLWIAGATLQNNNASGTAIYGTYRISAGRYENLTPDAMVVRETGQVLIEGGETYVDRFRPSNTSSSHRGSFIITGGTFYCKGTSTSPRNPDYARFSIPLLTQSFRMTGGTIQVENPANAPGMFHIGVNPNNAIVTGGTINVIVPATTTTTNAAILTTTPLWNLTITKAGTTGSSKALLDAIAVPNTFATGSYTSTAQPLTVLNNFTIGGSVATVFDATPSGTGATAQSVTIQGTLTIASGSTYLTGNNTTTFSGAQDQLLTNNGTIGATATGISTNVGTFNNWTINKSAGTLTLGGTNNSFVVVRTLSLLAGVLNDGGNTIYAQGSVVNSASHTSGGGSGSITLAGTGGQVVSGDGTGVFGNLTVSSTAAAGAVAATLTANMSVASTLTMASDNILAIGANRLSLTNVTSSNSSSGALYSGAGHNFSVSCFIQTAGNQSDLGLQKTYGKGDSFTFPVGTGTGSSARYAPATIELRLASTAPLDRFGQVSVSPVSSRHPFVTGTTNSLAYYWKVRSTGFGTIPNGSVYETFTMTNTDAATTSTNTNAAIRLANYLPARYLPVAWTKYTTGTGGSVSKNTNVSDLNISGISAFDGEFTAGESAAFGDITSYYSRATGNWRDATTWNTSTDGGKTLTAASAAPTASNPVFIGSAKDAVYHTVTANANTAQSGSLVIDRGSILDVGSTTGHNFGALPDAKIGGSGRLRVSAAGTANPLVATFPGGDFGSFIQYGGGTVEYYTSGKSFVLPTTSSTTTLTLNQYRNLWLNSTNNTQTITLPAQDLRIYAQLKAGVTNGTTTYPGTVLLSSGTAGNLRVDSLLAVQNGTLRLQKTTARTLTVDTDVRVESGARFNVANNAAITHALSVGGSLINNGKLDFKVGTGQMGLTFLSSQNTYLTSTGDSTDLYTLTLNKGLGRTAVLNLDGSGPLTTPSNGWLTLTNGTLRYAKPTSATLTIHDGVATPYLITDNAGLTVDTNGGTVTVATSNDAAADLKLAGQLQVLQGTLKVGATGNAGNDLEYASAGAPGLKITGGNLYVNGQIRRTVSNLDGSLRFDQSGGTIDIDGQGASAAQSNERGLFEVQGSKSIFRMSGGNLNLHRSNQKNPILTADLYLAPDSTVVTGGTVVLGNAATGIGNVTISVNSTVPLYDLRVETGANNTNTNTGLLTGVIPLTLKGSLTIGNDNSFFNANGLGLNIGQNLVNNNTSASTALSVGGFRPSTTTQLTTFTGNTATQQLTGTAANLTVFGSLMLNNPQTSGTLQLGGNAQVAGTLTLTKGTLDDNGKTITVLGDVLNSATHTSGGPGTGSMILAGTANQNIGGNDTGRFGNLTLTNSAGATATANQEITKVLTLTNGILNIGSNLLWLSNTGPSAVAGTFSATRAIQTNGIVADLGVRKSYPAAASDFTFPLGVAGKYTPVRMNVTSNTAVGTLTVRPVNIAHPSTTDPANKELNYYWKVSSTGFASPIVTQVFSYLGTDVRGTEANYKVGRFVSGAWTPQNGITASTVNTTNHALTNPNATYFDGDYTGGETSEFGAVPTYYSRNSTSGQTGGANWNDATAWTFNADGTDSSPLPTTFPTLANPVVINSGHLINSNGASRGAATLKMLGTLDLSTYGANNFNTVTGTGTVRIGSALFPAGNYSDFMTATGGTVDYSGAVVLPARDTYNNLTFSGGNIKQLSNLDLTINGVLNVAANTTVNNPTNQNITLTSTSSGAMLNGIFNLGDGALTTGASLTNTGTLNLGAGLVSVGANFTNSGTLNNGTGALNISATFNNTSTGTYKANVGTGDLTVGTTFTNSGSYVAGAGKLTVNGSFSNAAGGQFTAAGGDVIAAGDFTNAGTYTAAANKLRLASNFTNQSGGSFVANTSTTALQGNFTNAGSFDPGTGLVQFITDAGRTVTGSTTFYDVQKVNPGTLILGTNTTMTVANVLTMRNGLIATGASNILSLTNPVAQPIVGASTTSYVAGRLAMTLPNDAANIRVFPVGAGGRYRPVTITSQAAASAGDANPAVLVEIFNGAPTGRVDGTLTNLSANRYYRVQLQSGVINQPTVQLSFNTDVIDEEIHVPGNLRVAKLNTSNNTWGTAGGAGVFSPEDPRGYTISSASQTAITSTSFFALASTNSVDNPLTGPAPLPVTLLQFTAARQGAAVRVAWATASEQNSAYFVVQRSANGSSFEDLERVAAQGASASQHDYATLDAAPLTGVSYYRLRQVDTDGKYVYSPVVTVRFDGQGAATPALSAYPNPAAPGQGFQLLATNLSTSGGTVQVLDNVGRLVLTQVVTTGAAETTIQPNRPLASGMYFVTWQTPDGLKLTTKVAVQ